MASIVFTASIISRVNGLSISSIFKKSEWSFGKAIASIKAEFSKEGNFLKINNHILDQFELGLKISFESEHKFGSGRKFRFLKNWVSSGFNVSVLIEFWAEMKVRLVQGSD